MDAARFLGGIISQSAPASAAQLKSVGAYHALIDGGYIEEIGVAQSVLCDDCDRPHDAAVVFEADQYGIHCPDLGFIPKKRSELVIVRPNLERLVQNLADRMGCRRIKSTPIHCQTWRVGIVSFPSADVAVYFQPTLHDALDLRCLETALSNEARVQYGVILTASGELERPPFKTVRMEDCLKFDKVAMAFEFDADLVVIAGAPIKKKGGRPSAYSVKLSKIISARADSGKALSGLNEEARAIRAIYLAQCSTDTVPSISTIKRILTKT